MDRSVSSDDHGFAPGSLLSDSSRAILVRGQSLPPGEERHASFIIRARVDARLGLGAARRRLGRGANGAEAARGRRRNRQEPRRHRAAGLRGRAATARLRRGEAPRGAAAVDDRRRLHAATRLRWADARTEACQTLAVPSRGRRRRPRPAVVARVSSRRTHARQRNPARAAHHRARRQARRADHDRPAARFQQTRAGAARLGARSRLRAQPHDLPPLPQAAAGSRRHRQRRRGLPDPLPADRNGRERAALARRAQPHEREGAAQHAGHRRAHGAGAGRQALHHVGAARGPRDSGAELDAVAAAGVAHGQGAAHQHRRLRARGQSVRRQGRYAPRDLGVRRARRAEHRVRRSGPPVDRRERPDGRRRDQPHREGQELRLSPHLLRPRVLGRAHQRRPHEQAGLGAADLFLDAVRRAFRHDVLHRRSLSRMEGQSLHRDDGAAHRPQGDSAGARRRRRRAGA